MNSFLIDISEIRNGFQAEAQINVTTDIGSVELSGQKLNLPDLSVKGMIFPTNEGIIFRAKVEGEVSLECSRCLDKYNHHLNFELDDFYFYEKEEDEHFVENDSIDISLSIVQAIASTVDFKTLCKTDCLGICSKCGQSLNKNDCKCKNENIDIRWNKLQELKQKLNKNE